MKNIVEKKILKRVGISTLIVMFVIFSMPVLCYASESNKVERKIMVSMGDSYSSGEGIPPFYGQDEKISKKVENPDWLAHRSEKAWPSMLELPDINGVMTKNRKNENWFFVAASGATTQNIQYNFIKEYDTHGEKDSYPLDPQIKIFKDLGEKKADYVTLTLGGNDADFAGVIMQCVTNSSHLKPSHLTDKLNNTWKDFFSDGGIRDKLYDAYKAIAENAGPQAQIIVAGYPQLLDLDGILNKSKYLTLNELEEKAKLLLSYDEAKELNENVSKFNRAIESLVNTCKGNGMKIYFVSVEEEFEGHGAYAWLKEPYINPIYIPSKSEDLKWSISSAYSIHPNEKGAEAYARCVQAKIDELENMTSVATEYSPQIKVSVYDNNNELYDNYDINIEGKEFWGLFKSGWIKKDYVKTVPVRAAGDIKLILPKGDYAITVMDCEGENSSYKKDISVRSGSKNKILSFRTNFGDTPLQESNSNVSDENIPVDAVEYKGHYYYLYPNGIASSYNEALEYCKSKGGYLATLTSEEENDFVYSYIKQQKFDNAYFGLSDSGKEGVWEWCTGEPVSYINWHSGEPNGENSNEDYAMFYYKYNDGAWNDGDFGGNTLNGGTSFICEWGDYSLDQLQTPTDRTVVLTLDVSGSMSGTPLDETKKAYSNFIDTVLDQDANIGIVTYKEESNIQSGFSNDRKNLQSIVSSLYSGGGTNIEAGLKDAQWMLEKTNAKKKIIVLMSDGEPNNGLEGEELIQYANEIKESGTIIYTLGFFESLDNKSYAQYLMENIASDGCHYEVANADELVFFFEDMADQINGQKYIYVRIACPVDVSVTYNGETLDSSESNSKTRTSFGTLTFEENHEEMNENMDDKIKVLRLKEGVDYDLELTGTGHGVMNYTIGFMDDNGDYSDLRKFENIKITRKTKIDTVATYSDDSVLNIDDDGDGKYDLKLRAEANGYGEEVKTSYWIIYVIIGAVVLFFVDIIAITVYVKSKRRRKGE